MNNYGVVLNACGFEPVMDALQRHCVTPLARLRSPYNPLPPPCLPLPPLPPLTSSHPSSYTPLARLLFPKQGGDADHHHTFMVQYRHGEDMGP